MSEETKAELLEKAKELNVEGRSSMNKEELEKAVADAEGSSSEKEGLSPEGQDALEEMGEDSEAAKLADLPLDASGPLHLQSPSEREMTGAVTEEQAEEQEEVLADKPDDYVGSVSEAGFSESDESEPKGAPKDNLSENDDRDPEDVYEVRPEHVIDFPPPLAEREAAATGEEVKGDETKEQAPSGAFHTEPLGSGAQSGARSRLFEQKAVFYTDGLSGAADHNQDRAYKNADEPLTTNEAAAESAKQSESEASKEDSE